MTTPKQPPTPCRCTCHTDLPIGSSPCNYGCLLCSAPSSSVGELRKILMQAANEYVLYCELNQPRSGWLPTQVELVADVQKIFERILLPPLTTHYATSPAPAGYIELEAAARTVCAGCNNPLLLVKRWQDVPELAHLARRESPVAYWHVAKAGHVWGDCQASKMREIAASQPPQQASAGDAQAASGERLVSVEWSDRHGSYDPQDEESIVDVVLACCLDHSYDRTEDGIPHGMDDELAACLKPVIAEWFKKNYPAWKEETANLTDEQRADLKATLWAVLLTQRRNTKARAEEQLKRGK